MGTLLAFVLVSIGVLVLRRARPDLPRPFRTPWTPWVPVAAAAVCLLQMAVLPAATWVRLLVWLSLGFAIYFLYGARRARLVREGRVTPAAATVAGVP